MKEVTVAIIASNGKVLACQRRKTATYPLKWEFPGGKIEPGESARNALVRELFEELDIHAAPAEVFHVQEWNYGDASYRVTYFLVTHYTGSLLNKAFETLRWVTPSELLEMDILEGNREIVQKFVATAEANPHTTGQHDPCLDGQRREV